MRQGHRPTSWGKQQSYYCHPVLQCRRHGFKAEYVEWNHKGRKKVEEIVTPKWTQAAAAFQGH